jgi:formylglycine-generating enzyme required for sulfatase activity
MGLEMPRIFISYSRQDQEFALRLATSLRETGMDVWIDLEDIPAGMKWSSAIQEGLDSGELMIVIISPDSMASRNVEDEWQYYVDNSKPVIPVLLEPAKIHFQLSRIQYIDFHKQKYPTALNQLFAEFQRKGIRLENAPNVLDRQPISHVPPEYPTLVSASSKPPQRSNLILGLGVLGTLILIALAVVFLAVRGHQDADFKATTVAELSGSVVAVATSTIRVEFDQLAATQTAQAALNNPTDEPKATLTDTLIPPTPISAATIPPTETPISLGFPGNPVMSNSQWSPVSQMFGNTQMMLVPAGCFIMGSTDEDRETAVQQCLLVVNENSCRTLVADEYPQALTCFEQPFWIDRTEVTNRASGAGDNNLPRTNITWRDSQAYCKGLGGRLPTEAEWEYAARGPDGLNYPWGNQFDGSLLNYCDASCQFNWQDSTFNDNQSVAAEVGSYASSASWVGALDMGGNVWEWTSSLYWNYPYSPSDGRENPADTTSLRTLRGGSWNWISADARTSGRDDPIQDSSDWYGFRCARDY